MFKIKVNIKKSAQISKKSFTILWPNFVLILRNTDMPNKFIFIFCVFICLFPIMTSALALFLGIIFGISFGNPWPKLTQIISKRLLTFSIIGLGAGMNLEVIGRVGANGIIYTAVGISFTLIFGKYLGKILGCSGGVSTLVSIGTAICGGSAIAAVAPVLKSKEEDVSVALATVFLLNAAALLLFPWLGHFLGLTPTQFGLWSALAIHDTSSVVGATLEYGGVALEIGTTVKLARALWIIPVTLLIAMVNKGKDGDENKEATKKPWFILGFLAAATLVTYIPALSDIGHSVELLARRLMVITLFLIGSNLSKTVLAKVGARPLVQGIILWIFVASGTLLGVFYGVITL